MRTHIILFFIFIFFGFNICINNNNSDFISSQTSFDLFKDKIESFVQDEECEFIQVNNDMYLSSCFIKYLNDFHFFDNFNEVLSESSEEKEEKKEKIEKIEKKENEKEIEEDELVIRFPESYISQNYSFKENLNNNSYINCSDLFLKALECQLIEEKERLKCQIYYNLIDENILKYCKNWELDNFISKKVNKNLKLNYIKNEQKELEEEEENREIEEKKVSKYDKKLDLSEISIPSNRKKKNKYCIEYGLSPNDENIVVCLKYDS